MVGKLWHSFSAKYRGQLYIRPALAGEITREVIVEMSVVGAPPRKIQGYR